MREEGEERGGRRGERRGGKGEGGRVRREERRG